MRTRGLPLQQCAPQMQAMREGNRAMTTPDHMLSDSREPRSELPPPCDNCLKPFSAHHEEEFRFKGLQVGADYFVWKEELDGASLSRMVDSLFSAPTAHQPADA